MMYRERKTSGWRIAVAVVVPALLACGLLIFLAVRKVAVEKKVERKFTQEEPLGKPAPTFPPLGKPEG